MSERDHRTVSARAAVSLRAQDTIEHFSSLIKGLQNMHLQLIKPAPQTNPKYCLITELRSRNIYADLVENYSAVPDKSHPPLLTVQGGPAESPSEERGYLSTHCCVHSLHSRSIVHRLPSPTCVSLPELAGTQLLPQLNCFRWVQDILPMIPLRPDQLTQAFIILGAVDVKPELGSNHS